jgi:hypothetical protein
VAPDLKSVVSDPTEGYSPPGDTDEHPLGGYALLMSVFCTAFTGSIIAARRRGHDLPEHISAGDILITGIATHKLSRLLTKDKVTATIRAPFTQYEESTGYGEVSEKPRGTGMRRSIGELLLCPFCMSQWVAGAFAVGLVVAPRFTRLLASMWTAQSVADAAQLAYVAGEKRA